MKTKEVNNEYHYDNHVMVDIETLSTKSAPVVTQLTMVRFCPFSGETFESITHHINIQSCLDIGLGIDENTLKFWFNQSREAQLAAIKFGEESEHIMVVLDSIRQFLSKIEDVRMWGKGPSFDLAKLSNIYQLGGYPDKPWNFWNERCVRTMIADVIPSIELKFNGVKHNSYDDCIHQINQIKVALNVKYQ